MEEGQIHPEGPAPVLGYATGRGGDVEAEWRDGPEGLEFHIPPPAIGRQVFLPSLSLAAAFPLFFLGCLGTAAAASNSKVPGTVIFGAVALLALRWGLRSSRRLVRAARHGARPTVIAVSPEWLTLVSPWLPEDRPYRLPRFSVTGLRLDEVQTLPGLMRSVRLRVILREEDFFNLKFPWRANFPLAHAEWRLHDALALGPRNFSPPVAAAVQTTDRCANSS